jgi:hypothetical protein
MIEPTPQLQKTKVRETKKSYKKDKIEKNMQKLTRSILSSGFDADRGRPAPPFTLLSLAVLPFGEEDDILAEEYAWYELVTVKFGEPPPEFDPTVVVLVVNVVAEVVLAIAEEEIVNVDAKPEERVGEVSRGSDLDILAFEAWSELAFEAWSELAFEEWSELAVEE